MELWQTMLSSRYARSFSSKPRASKVVLEDRPLRRYPRLCFGPRRTHEAEAVRDVRLLGAILFSFSISRGHAGARLHCDYVVVFLQRNVLFVSSGCMHAGLRIQPVGCGPHVIFPRHVGHLCAVGGPLVFACCC